MSKVGSQGGNEAEELDNRQKKQRGGVVTLTTVIGLLLATALTLFGVGAADHVVANFDVSSWLWSSSRGEMSRVNGVTARIDTRTKVKDARNHEIQVSQTDRYLILRDLNTGQVSTLDLATLQIGAVMPTDPGLGVSVALHGATAFIIDAVQGQVRQLDPATLAPSGELLRFPPGITAGEFDDTGTLWLGVPTEGTVVAISAGRNRANPKVLRTVTVAPPNHDLALTVLDEGVAVLDSTIGAVVWIHGNKVRAASVPVTRPATVPPRTSGERVPVTVAADRHVYVVDGPHIVDIAVPGNGGSLEPAVTFAGHIYCADPAANIVYEFDAHGTLINRIHIASGGGHIELEVREGRLFINAPDGSTARVVDDGHHVGQVNKYDNGVLGGDPPPTPPTPPPPPKPVVRPPGKPRHVVAAAGDASARVSWRPAPANGATITKYVITGAGHTVTAGAHQRSVEIKGLTNGRRYRFKVHAVNAKGPGPDALSNPVVPTSEVPDPPTSVTATANPDGTVEVTWPAANGQGHKIARYTVTSVSDGARSPIGEVQGTRMLIPAGTLSYGTQYAFTVVSVNDKGGGSKPSPVSNTVVPFAKPGVVKGLTAATVSNQKGAIRVSWQPAEDNGRPVITYVVEAAGGSQEMTAASITLTGLGDDQAVKVAVSAVNEAGHGPSTSATARTVGAPKVTLTSDRAGYNSLTVTFTPNNKGGDATCTLSVDTAGSANTKCTTQPVSLTVNGLWPNRTYRYTITMTNPAGAATVSRSRATNQLRFTVVCPKNTGGYCDTGIWAYKVTSQADPGQALAPALGVGTQGVPQCHTTGDSVNAKPWGGKQTNVWLRLNWNGKTGYFPWAWAVLDGGDSVNLIPAC